MLSPAAAECSTSCAIQEHCGLKLESRKSQVPVLVVEKAERIPTPRLKFKSECLKFNLKDASWRVVGSMKGAVNINTSPPTGRRAQNLSWHVPPRCQRSLNS